MPGFDTSALQVTIIYEDVRSPAEVITISSGGIFLRTGLLLELGAQVELEFAHGDEALLVTQAQVTRIEPGAGSDEEIGLGLRYLDMTPKNWLALERVLVDQSKTGSEASALRMPNGFSGVAPTSQRFRILHQETERRIQVVLAEIRELQDELQHRLSELQELLVGGRNRP